MARDLTWANGLPRSPVFTGAEGRILDRTFREWKTVEEASKRTLPLLAELAAAATGDHREVLFHHLHDLCAAIEEATRPAAPANDTDPTDPPPAVRGGVPLIQQEIAA